MVGLRPKVPDRVRTTEGKRNQVIHLVVSFIGGCYPVFRVRLFSKCPRHGPRTFFEYPGTQISWIVTSNTSPGVSLGSGRSGVGC
jgi:hypothetical protein